MIPVKCPLPVDFATYSKNPPADGYRAPSLANEYPCNPATIPASRNDSHTAAPATSPAAPSSAKIPAPTIAPTPMNAACRTDRYFFSCVPGGGAGVGSPSSRRDSCFMILPFS